MKKPTYECIRHLTVGELKSYPSFILRCVEKDIKNETERAALALTWIKNIRNIKARETQGGQNGK